MNLRYLLTLIFIYLFSSLGIAQLDNRHYFPPLHCKDGGELTQHYIYLSTPETTPFQVAILDGAGMPQSLETISAGNPAVYKIADDGLLNHSKIFVPRDEVNTVLSNKGLIVQSLGNHKFYAEMRVDAISFYHATAYTAKGLSAAGKTFRVGMFPQQVHHNLNDFTVGIMSLEDNNTITVSDFDPGVVLQTPTSPITPGGNLTIQLNRGQTYILTGYTDTPQNLSGFLGALIESTEDIVVTSGNFSGGIHPTLNGRDYGVDQMVPISKLGTEYVTIAGNGDASVETPIIVAHYDNTSIYINGNTTPIATINGGDYFVIPYSNYQGSTHRNMFIRTSKPAYVIQALAGNTSYPDKTSDFNLIPPIHCRLTNEIDAIPDVNHVGTTTYNGAVFVITTAGSTVQLNGVTQTGAIPTLAGGYETYRIASLSGNQKITSTGPVQAGIFGYSLSAAYSAFYSGFTDRPAGEMELQRDEVCQNDVDSLTFTVKDGTAPYTFDYSINGNNYSVTTSDTTVTIPIDTDVAGTYWIKFNSLSSMDVHGASSCDYAMFDSLLLVVKPNPTMDPLVDKEICLEETIELNATNTGTATVTWNNGVANGQTITPTTVGNNEYIVTVDLDGCEIKDTLNVLVNAMPNVEFTADITEGCLPLEVHFQANANSGLITTCLWDFGDGNISTDCEQAFYTYITEGAFDVTYIVSTDKGCSDTLKKDHFIITHRTPTADFVATPTTTEITSPEVEFTNQSVDANHYSWNFGDGQQSTAENPNHIFPHEDAGTYTVILIATTDFGCADTTSQLITLLAPAPHYDVPNIFTPNNDGKNDVFALTSMDNIKQVEVVILNRWGMIVFESSDSTFEWNGKVNNNGEDCTEGVYFYEMTITAENSDKYFEKGFVHLVR